MTLCPISRFSRILAIERPLVPAIQAGGNAEASKTAREPSSSLRWASDLADVSRVLGATRFDDVLTDRGALAADMLEDGHGEMSGWVAFLAGDRGNSGVPSRPVVEVVN